MDARICATITMSCIGHLRSETSSTFFSSDFLSGTMPPDVPSFPEKRGRTLLSSSPEEKIALLEADGGSVLQ